MIRTYDVTAYREGRWWMVEIPALEGLTQARRFEDVAQVAREYIAVTTNAPMSDVDVMVRTIEADGHEVTDVGGAK